MKSKEIGRSRIRNFISFSLLLPLTWALRGRALDLDAPGTFTRRIRSSAIEQLSYNLAAHFERRVFSYPTLPTTIIKPF